jgi:hypothetical protein
MARSFGNFHATALAYSGGAGGGANVRHRDELSDLT